MRVLRNDEGRSAEIFTDTVPAEPGYRSQVVATQIAALVTRNSSDRDGLERRKGEECSLWRQ